MKGIRRQGVVHTLDSLFMHDDCGSTADDRTGCEVECFKKARVNCGRVTRDEGGERSHKSEIDPEMRR